VRRIRRGGKISWVPVVKREYGELPIIKSGTVGGKVVNME